MPGAGTGDGTEEAVPDDGPARPRRRGGRIDWVVGILLGIALGIAVVIGFLVFGSEETIDAPNISGNQVTAPSGSR